MFSAKSKSYATVAMVLAAGSVHARCPSTVGPGEHLRSVTVGGVPRHFYVSVTMLFSALLGLWFYRADQVVGKFTHSQRPVRMQRASVGTRILLFDSRILRNHRALATFDLPPLPLPPSHQVRRCATSASPFVFIAIGAAVPNRFMCRRASEPVNRRGF
jgi:hypothetical protein